MAFTPASLLRCLLACLVMLVSSAAASSGMGTAYGGAGQRGSGACGIGGNLGRYETYYAAMNHGQYGGSCGKCIRVCGKAGCAVLKVVDMCPGCGHGDVDMSSEALKATTGYSWDRKPISWSYTSCGSSGSTSSRKISSKKCRCRSGRRGNSCRRTCKKHRGL